MAGVLPQSPQTLYLEKESTEGNVIQGKAPLSESTSATPKEKAGRPLPTCLLCADISCLDVTQIHIFDHVNWQLIYLSNPFPGRIPVLAPCALGHGQTIQSGHVCQSLRSDPVTVLI